MLAKLGAIWKLARFEHALMLGAAVVLGIIIGAKGAGVALPGLQTIVLAALVSVFIEVGAFAQNDVADERADRENKRKERPIVSGAISAGEANLVAWAAYIIGCAIAYSLGSYPFSIALFFTALSVAYNYMLKDIALLGNAAIAASMAIPFVFGSIVASGGAVGEASVAIASVAFVAGLGREIGKTVEDMAGDNRARGSRTIPFIIGRKNALLLSTILYVFVVPLSLVPFLSGLEPNALAMVMVGAGDIAFLYIAVKSAQNADRKELAQCRRISLAALGIGLLGYLAAAVL